MTTIAIIAASTAATEAGEGVTTLGGVSAVEFDASRAGHCAVCASGLADDDVVNIYVKNHSETAWTPVDDGGAVRQLTATSRQCSLTPGAVYGLAKSASAAAVEVFGIINVQNVG